MTTLPLWELPEDTDAGLTAVEEELYRLDPSGDIVAGVLRDTLDQLYDGQHSGRWAYEQLHKTEKTHMGTLVEINLHRRFGFGDGDATDYRIAGFEVDCKYSMSYGGWELPPEAVGHLCLVLTADDASSSWTAGLIRVREPDLRGAANRDAKRQLTAASRARIRELWPAHGRLAGNLFLRAWTRRSGGGSSAHGPRAARTTAGPGPTSCSAACSAGSSAGPSWPPSRSRMTSCGAPAATAARAPTCAPRASWSSGTRTTTR